MAETEEILCQDSVASEDQNELNDQQEEAKVKCNHLVLLYMYYTRTCLFFKKSPLTNLEEMFTGYW